MEPQPIDMTCNLFGVLLKFAQSHNCLSNTDLCSLFNLSDGELEELKNNITKPSDELINLFSNEFDVKPEQVKYFCFHDAEPSKLSLKFRKWMCLKIAKFMTIITFKPVFATV